MLCTLNDKFLNSDRPKVSEVRYDIMMKDIALSARRKYKLMADDNGQDLFDVSERRKMIIKSKVPINMIKFKNKSEQKRYLRIAQCILVLNDSNLQKSHNDIEFTFMKIFRFLADMLTESEFDSLSYYHVNRFISSILKLSFEHDDAKDDVLNPVSLRQFVCSNLDLKY